MSVSVQEHWQGRRRLGHAWSKRHVRTAGIVMWYPGVEQASQVVFCQRDKAIEALPPQRANKPLAEGVRLGTLRRRFQDPEPQVLYTLIELS